MSGNKSESYYDTTLSLSLRTAALGLQFLNATDERLDGRTLRVGGREVVSFASCSYLGLEHDSRLKLGAIDAVMRYGTQFSYSRGFVSAPPYAEVERLLGVLFGGHVVMAPSTRLAHQSLVPVLVREGDAVLRDKQVHESLRNATDLLRQRGITVQTMTHNAIDQLEEVLRELATRHRRVFVFVDGIYSMFGDAAPLRALRAMLDDHEQMHLYIDDAHGMSWAGTHGRGYALSQIDLHPRMLLTTSLNKAFAAAGGAIVVPDAALAERVRGCGMPMLFSGPVQPPMLGAALASARVHLSEDIVALQAALRERIDRLNRRLAEHDLAAVSTSPAPIRFVVIGSAEDTFRAAGHMLEHGLFVGPATYPAVPAHQSGLRLTVTVKHRLEDIDRLVATLAEVAPHSTAVAQPREAWPA